MKVKHALGIGLTSLLVIGGCGGYILDRHTLTNEEIESYTKNELKVKTKVYDKVINDDNTTTYTVKTQDEQPFTFSVHVKNGFFPMIEGSNYTNRSQNEELVALLKKAEPSFKQYHFKLAPNPVQLGVDDKNKDVTKITLHYSGDLSIFGLDDKTYDDLYHVIKIVNNLDGITNPYLYLDDQNSGVITFSGLAKYTNVKAVQVAVKTSVQSQMGADDKRVKKFDSEDLKETDSKLKQENQEGNK